ncbi:protein of unknown function [Candidatus Methylomirabilis oxygeniifera]|uniref:Uncharacterized protein n=1 Tax=Methylomirabilis oxygeniifera TaxID=671143 RepID=D5MHM0_METO1|nr:protein of unknown function [Candidatus Methylomirabilis oxyfera]
MQRTEKAECEPLNGRDEQRGTAIVAKALPQACAGE